MIYVIDANQIDYANKTIKGSKGNLFVSYNRQNKTWLSLRLKDFETKTFKRIDDAVKWLNDY